MEIKHQQDAMKLLSPYACYYILYIVFFCEQRESFRLARQNVCTIRGEGFLHTRRCLPPPGSPQNLYLYLILLRCLLLDYSLFTCVRVSSVSLSMTKPISHVTFYGRVDTRRSPSRRWSGTAPLYCLSEAFYVGESFHLRRIAAFVVCPPGRKDDMAVAISTDDSGLTCLHNKRTINVNFGLAWRWWTPCPAS